MRSDAGPHYAGPNDADGASFGDLLQAIRAYAADGIFGTLSIITLAAVLESAGLVLLVPVAETIFAGEGKGAARSGLTMQIAAWMEAVGLNSVLQQLAGLGVIFIALVALRAVVLLRRDIVLMQMSQGFIDRVRLDFFSLLAHADWPVIKRYRKAELLNTMTTNVGRLGQAIRFLSSGIVVGVLGLAYLASAFVVSVALGLALLGLIAIGGVFAAIWSRRSHRLGRQLNQANRFVMHETTTFLDGMKAAKAARAEDELSRRFAGSIAEARLISVQFVTQQGRLRNSIQFIASVAALLVLLLGYGVIGLNGGELVVMAAIVMRLAPNLVTTLTGVQSLAHAMPAFESIRAIEGELRRAKASGGIVPGREPSGEPPADQPLEAKAVSVEVNSLAGENITLVRADDLLFAPGTLVHVGGPSGAGKSTLVELFAGLHLPAQGMVSRGAYALDAASRPGWQARVSFAPQEPFIFDGTVRENLCWPNVEADDQQLWAALETAGAGDIVARLPAGLDEPMLDGGARLSGGERQRLCLARALLRPADLLILDEATSAMDAELERSIIGRLRQDIGNRVVLMVSHSLNAVMHADQRIEVTGGHARVVG
ncbi:ATP-binding cassette domain-containing protein [Erythrobacter arachoides]|uniref:ATP-binding cassette domain-containing protein n=1 Tax=Aurantiacibacter arachoides TaxID=1850444 RepID=A0A845A183_9SPHN|nr:ABC transporter ATP-binding protein [Aurantiacibacter arachoides]MXO93688.1 ATP-binding cassette domain-containing protein [Aurantiacibacter arachoides]GGD47417.1 ABC transporter ATP-binding protein [Aurantiacibacter arachoides]